jgi:hypothetical protein
MTVVMMSYHSKVKGAVMSPFLFNNLKQLIMMSKVEMRGLQVILAIMIIGMTWLIAIGEGAFIHHLILCASVLAATASLLVTPDKD